MEGIIQPFSVMVAVCRNRGIGYKGELPWPHFKSDYEYLTATVNRCQPGKQNAIICGRHTWFDTGDGKNNTARYNIVISKTLSQAPEGSNYLVPSLHDALVHASNLDYIENIWIFGGEGVYEGAIKHPMCQKIYITRIEADFEADRFFPEFENDYELTDDPAGVLTQVERGVTVKFEVYQRKQKQLL
ncbi:dihydrofolate reductase-like isoform X2 [Lineus longissimus]|uniref:dihydrofolate reductase-like isoform X2 n=1 Tax=Lineus longissimus TaxID=88925 RepID=UPI00315C9305